jgi:hypothetical protein
LKRLTGGNDLRTSLSSKGVSITPESLQRLESALHWLDMSTPVASSAESVFDAFCDFLEHRLVYEEGERDMVAMHHEFGIKWGSGREEKRMSTMIAYGDPNNYSAMAKTVGYPAAVATDMILSSI